MSARSIHVCQQCGYRSAKWLGRCPECGEWSSLVEEAEAAPPGKRAEVVPTAIPYPEIDTREARRSSTASSELDRVLGGGLVPGAVVLVGGEPGIGKSTLLLQTASRLAEAGRTVLYASGEESATQLRGRGDRLGVGSPRLLVAAATDVDGITEAARRSQASLLIVDSIQAVRCAGLSGVPGSVGQVREAASRFVAHAKSRAVPVLLVGHVTKEGSIAGPRALEHVVDTVLQFEGDRHHEHRILRALKNRFGPTDELGVFEMTDRGMLEVNDPSRLLLADRLGEQPGSAVLAAVEGTRPLLVEIQALVGHPIQGSPRRAALGVDPNRLAMILAVLQRGTGLELANRDVFVNVTGGLSVQEPAADLAVAAAVASSALARPLPHDAVVAGEVGLTGEVRPVARMEARLREAARLGFRRALVPRAAAQGAAELEVSAVERVGDLFASLLEA